MTRKARLSGVVYIYIYFKCPLKPLYSDILPLIDQFLHLELSAQTPLFGHFTFDHSTITL